MVADDDDDDDGDDVSGDDAVSVDDEYDGEVTMRCFHQKDPRHQ